MKDKPNTENIDPPLRCPSYEELSDYYHGKLAEEENEQVKQHVKECHNCAEALSKFTTPRPNPPISDNADSGRKTGKYILLAVALFAVFGIFFFVFHLFQNKDKVIKATTAIPLSKYQTGPDSSQVKSMPASPTYKMMKKLVKKRTHAEHTVDYIYNLKVSDYKTLYFKQQKQDSSQLNADVNQNVMLTERKNGQTDSITADKVLRRALSDFNTQQYKDAIDNLKLLIDHNADDVNALFYTGICYARLHRPSDAIEYLDRVLKSSNTVFHPESEWFKALALIDKKDNAAARKLLKSIEDRKGFYAERAKKKLKTM